MSSPLHVPAGEHAAPTVGSTTALLGIQAGRDGIAAAAIPPNPHFERIGGGIAIRALVERFYHHMDTLPEARGIRALHPPNLEPVKEVLWKYFVGWMGGPQLYAAERGHPRLRRRHLSFPIGDAERDAWMQCMTLALAEVVTDDALREELAQAFYKTATFLRNQE
jgi:hemoglobin